MQVNGYLILAIFRRTDSSDLFNIHTIVSKICISDSVIMAAKGKSSSKFRFIEGTPVKNRDWYNDVRVGNPGVDCNPIKANSKYFAVPWVTPGTVAVVSLSQVGFEFKFMWR